MEAELVEQRRTLLSEAAVVAVLSICYVVLDSMILQSSRISSGIGCSAFLKREKPKKASRLTGSKSSQILKDRICHPDSLGP